MPQKRDKNGFRGPSPDVGKSTQFKPGNRANPGGRPHKKPVSSALEELIDEATARKIAATLIKQACRADRNGIAAAKEIIDRLEGKAVQVIEADVREQITTMTDEELRARFKTLGEQYGLIGGDGH